MFETDVPIVLAQSEGSAGQAAMWALVLMAVVIAGGLVAVFIRKRARSGAETPALGLTLADLREMKADGRLTEEEFERAKAMVVGQLGGKVERLAPERVRIEGRIVDGELRARTGFDLTGQPLPDFGGQDNPPEQAGDENGDAGP